MKEQDKGQIEQDYRLTNSHICKHNQLKLQNHKTTKPQNHKTTRLHSYITPKQTNEHFLNRKKGT